MNKPLVTIAIPSYNHSMYIQFCLDSIRDDDYPNKQILIIDDGSTDDTVDKIIEWRTNNSDVALDLVSRPNKGINATLNDLIANTKGEYIVFIASDDAIIKGSIQIRVDVLENNPEKYIVIGDVKVIDENNSIIMESGIVDLYKGNKENYKSDELLMKSVVAEFSIPGPVFMLRRSIYDIIGLYPINQFAEDINFYMKTIGLRMVIFIDHPMALYRIHENNTGGNPKYSKQLSMTFIKAYVANLKYYPFILQLKIIKKLIGRVYLYIRASFK